jgi:hypothetical protein
MFPAHPSTFALTWIPVIQCCSYTRNIVISSPELWCCIDGGWSTEWIKLCAQRACTRPLVLDYSIDNQLREDELSDPLPKSMAARLRLRPEECHYLAGELLFLRSIVLSSGFSGTLLLIEFAPSTQLCLQDITIYDSAFLLSLVPLPSLRSLNLIRVEMFDPLIEIPQILNLKEGLMKHSIAHTAQAQPKLVLPRLRVLRLSGRLAVIDGLM